MRMPFSANRTSSMLLGALAWMVAAGGAFGAPSVAQAAVAWHPGEFVYKSPAQYGGVKDVAVGDVTGDGLKDLVVADYYTQSLVVIPNTGSGTFGPPVVTNLGPDAGYSPISLDLASLNGDAALDVVVGTSGQVGGSYQSHLLTLFGSGSGAFVGAMSASASPPSFARVAFMNANGDATPDLAVQTLTNVEIGVGNGDGTFTFPASLKFPFTASDGDNAASQPAVGDLNGDGIDDVAVGTGTGGATGAVHVLLSGPGGTYAETTLPSSAGIHSAVAIGDFNGDSANDVVAAQASSGPVLGQLDIWNGDGAGGLTSGPPIFADGDPFGLVAADFDNDGRQDLMTANYGIRADFPTTGRYPSSVNWIRNTAAGLDVLPVVAQQSFVSPGFGIAAGDVNGDGVPDVAVATYNGLLLYSSYDDMTAPAALITSGPGESAHGATAQGARRRRHPLPTTRNRRPTFAFTAKEGRHKEKGAAFTCRMDRKQKTPCRSPFQVQRLKLGRHVFRVQANDLAQNRGKPARVRFVVKSGH